MREFEYIPGRIVELVPLDTEGYGVGSWEVVRGGVTIVDNKFTMPDEDVKIVARYQAVLYSLTINGQNGEYSGAGSYRFNQSVSISAVPNDGYSFDRWEGFELADDANTGFSMPSRDLTITAIYTAKKYSVIINGYNGTQQGSGSEYIINQNVNIVAEPSVGYGFTEWQVDSGGIPVPISSSDYFSMPANNVEITAIYNLVDYTVQVIGADGGGTYNMGDTVALSLTPSAGYQFSNWNIISGSVSVVANSFTMPASNVEIEAVYEAKKYTVTVNGVNGVQTGSGSNYIIGDKINISAAPNTGYSFTKWVVDSGGVSISSESFNMPDNNVVITAVYTAIEYDVSITGIHGTQSHGGVKYKMGDTVVVSFTADTGYEFDYWNVIQGGVSVSSNSFAMPASNVSVEIVYKLRNYSLTINGTNGSQVGAGSYVMGEEVDIEAVPSAGWEFSEWQGYTFINKDLSITKLTMPADDLIINAAYSLARYEVIVNGGTGGGSREYNSMVTLTPEPDVGYEFVDWTVNSGSVTIPFNSFTMPNNDVGVTANFQPKQYTLKVNGGAGGGTKDYDSQVTPVAEPSTGYEFVSWTVDSGGTLMNGLNSINTDALGLVFTMPDHDVEVTANFELREYDVIINMSGSGAGTVSGAGKYKMGDPVAVSAVVGDHSAWDNWSGTAANATFNDKTLLGQTFDMPAMNLVFVANFTPIYYQVTTSVGSGSGTVSKLGDKYYGQAVSINATASSGYDFSSWTVIDGGISTPAAASPATFSMPGNDVSLRANFVGEPRTLKITSSWLGSITATVGGTAHSIPSSTSRTINTKMGESVSISINQGSGHFTYFSGYSPLPPGSDVLPRAPANVYNHGAPWFWIPDLSFTMGAQSLEFSAYFVSSGAWTSNIGTHLISSSRSNYSYAHSYWEGQMGYSNP